MLTSKLVVVIFAVLCCTSEVICYPRNSVKSYKFHNKHLVTGKNNVDKGSLAYAVCKTGQEGRSAKCTVTLDKNVFTNFQSFSCPVDLITEHADGIIKYGEALLWGENKVIFVWRELFEFPQKEDDDDNDDDDYEDDDHDDYYDNEPNRALVTIQIFNMTTCQSKVQKLEVDHTGDEGGQILITTSLNSFDVFFRDDNICDAHYCRMTVDEDNQASTIQAWFPVDDIILVYSLENIEENPNKIVIAIDENELLTYYLLRDNKLKTLGCNTEDEDLGWSSSNGILSFCTISQCRRFNYNGISLDTVPLTWNHEPANEIIALYNTPTPGHLAVICDIQDDSNYRFVKIGEDGVEQYSDNLADLKCSFPPDHLTVKIFQKSNTEYCVSSFHAMNGERGSGKFRMFCYTLDDMLN